MRKITIIIVSCCTAFLLLGFAGYRGYQMWKEKNWVKLAKEYAARSDGRNTMLCLQQVLRFNSKNAEACRMMAEMHEGSRSPAALLWRDRVLELDPNSLDARLAYAKTALVLGNYAAATNALEAVSASGRNTAAYHNLAGLVAFPTGDRQAAAAHFIEATRLEPSSEALQVNLAKLRLSGTNALDSAEARIALTRISLNSTNANLRCLALRELVDDARRSNQKDSALAFSGQLVEQTNSMFQDRALRLDVLREYKEPSFSSTLAAFKRDAGDDPAKIFPLAVWQMARLGPTNAMAWLSGLPPATQTNQLIAIAMADCMALLKQWSESQSALTKQNWGDLDFLRHAFLTRSLREQGLTGAAKAEWVNTLEAAGTQKLKEAAGVPKIRLAKLLEFTAAARWSGESEEILWKIVNLYPDDQLASQGLARVLYETGRTPLLLDLLTLQHRRKPAELSVQNNLAMTALLLNAQQIKPHDLAKEIYQKSPTNASFASTYAFSLHLQKKDAEALKVMQQLKPQAFEDPSIAGYYGLILKANGDMARATTYLGRASKGKLLPEEKKLFAQAQVSP